MYTHTHWWCGCGCVQLNTKRKKSNKKSIKMVSRKLAIRIESKANIQNVLVIVILFGSKLLSTHLRLVSM